LTDLKQEDVQNDKNMYLAFENYTTGLLYNMFLMCYHMIVPRVRNLCDGGILMNTAMRHFKKYEFLCSYKHELCITLSCPDMTFEGNLCMHP